MSYTTTITTGKISEKNLIALIDQIAAITKADIKIGLQFVVTTEDPNISSMLDSLMDAMPDEPTVRSNGHKEKKAAKAKSEMTSHQVRIDATGEIISTQAFNKRIAAGYVAELTSVTNAKGEQLVVIDGKLAKGPQS